jgi:hypothetical protein
MIQLFGLLDANKLLEAGKEGAFVSGEPADAGGVTAATQAGRSRAKKQLAEEAV